MTVTVMNDYLVFPVYTHSANKKLVFQYEGEVVYQLNLKLDHASPDFYAYIIVFSFLVQKLEKLYIQKIRQQQFHRQQL